MENASSLLFDSAGRGDLEEVKKLLAEGADVNCRDTIGWTPLIKAAWMGHLHVVRYLLEQGAEIDRQNDFGYTALMSAISSGHHPVVHYLLERGADVSLKDKYGKTVIDYLFEYWKDSPKKEEILKLFRESSPEELMEWYLDNGTKLKR
ncbi:MAG: ankyrin repeat domain-containing protein [Thermodesulfovibrionales bacterium]